MRWIVDGNNVFGARPDGWWKDRAGAARRLAAEVQRWQHATGDRVTLVFDGGEQPELTTLANERNGEFEVVFAGPAGHSGRDAADHLIVELVEASCAEEADLTVVTSDAGLVGRLPPGVTIVGAGRFRRQLDI